MHSTISKLTGLNQIEEPASLFITTEFSIYSTVQFQP